ncbi:hypothetical protein PAXRUDRAFT_830378 [Paxillus rubicundulus Ve08.2h10]|uniref:Uncharacterized protein n=1 Tax=Paxillus rubicundulus Ve08.2h10 TaxID=930991 RepID=A0A0D0D5N7_9AGAM|nr:hypothetical protein PAXRUDRAFT_830378 [Paxillus rubicundulus Ve08.2h10]
MDYVAGRVLDKHLGDLRPPRGSHEDDIRSRQSCKRMAHRVQHFTRICRLAPYTSYTSGGA